MRKSKGFGLLELTITLEVVSLLAALAVPSYDRYAQRARVTRSIGDIGRISIEIGIFQLKNNNALPGDFKQSGVAIPVDPWDQPEVYLNIATAGPGNGNFRKDKNLNPLNTDFDLYSSDKDGDSKCPLNAKASRDDIVRANNRAFIGLAEHY